MFIGTRKPLAVGTDTTLAFTMPKSDIPIKARGEVTWIGEKGMGLKFKEVRAKLDPFYGTSLAVVGVVR